MNEVHHKLFDAQQTYIGELWPLKMGGWKASRVVMAGKVRMGTFTCWFSDEQNAERFIRTGEDVEKNY